MKALRWLLPFTHGVDMHALEYVVCLAQSAGAMLIPVLLISTSLIGARLEHIQQSQDFLLARPQRPEGRHLSPTGCADHGGTPVGPDEGATWMTVYVGKKEAYACLERVSYW